MEQGGWEMEGKAGHIRGGRRRKGGRRRVLIWGEEENRGNEEMTREVKDLGSCFNTLTLEYLNS